MSGDIELGSRGQVATPTSIWSRTESLWRRAGANAEDALTSSTSTDSNPRVEPNSERRRAPQNPTKRSRRSHEEVEWGKYFSGRLAHADHMKRNGKLVDCSGFLFLCWHDRHDVEDRVSLVVAPIPDTTFFSEVELFHAIRDQWLEITGRWKRYSPFHVIHRVDFIRVRLSHINPAGHCRALLLSSDQYTDMSPTRLMQLSEVFTRCINDPELLSGGEAALLESQFHSVDNLIEIRAPQKSFDAYLIQEEVQFTRTWVSMGLTTMAIAITVIVGLKVVFPSWETTFAAGSYIATVVTIPAMLFISRLDKLSIQNIPVRTANHRKHE